ncbi:hypothetical protein AAFF_G00307840 [Aldrovandia affinis]|uniref:Podocalyxin-like protein 2 n=1 Tax=Aldrovandia affinis TaxID=143900 RepID=A0AAD7R8E4_9TELE|nr:hypothetical protein AAFF_G00307840 [Aldrovandia affinis]
MPWLCLHCNFIVGSALILLVPCDLSSLDQVLFSTSLDPTQPSLDPRRSLDLAEQGETISLDADGPAVPGFMGGSQESGFSSEEAEDPKALPPQYFWDEGGEANGTNLDLDSPEGNSPVAFQPSASPQSPLLEMPTDLNSSSPLVPLGESLDPDLWEIQGETSGGPSEPAYSLPTTDVVPQTHKATTDTDTGPVLLWDRGTASPAEAGAGEGEELGRTHVDVSTQPTAVIERYSPWPEHLPTDETEDDDTPSVLTAVQQGGASVHHTPLTTIPSSSPSSSSLAQSVTFTLPQGQNPKLKPGGTETNFQDKHPPHDTVICVNWSDFTGKGYVILSMSKNFDCDEFRVESGDRLLEMLETAFSRKMNSPQGSWLISLSKPTRQDPQLLMTLASDQGVIAAKKVLSMLGEVRRGLHDIGIQNYTSVTSCQSRPSQARSDYGKLFVVLVIIGSVCVVIIATGLIYICWQRRLPKMKNMSRGEELHFVENGCHDNPTLDVTSDSQSEMQEKKHSANGVMAGGGGGSGWQVLVNKPGKEEAENLEEDTHL